VSQSQVLSNPVTTNKCNKKINFYAWVRKIERGHLCTCHGSSECDWCRNVTSIAITSDPCIIAFWDATSIYFSSEFHIQIKILSYPNLWCIWILKILLQLSLSLSLNYPAIYYLNISLCCGEVCISETSDMYKVDGFTVLHSGCDLSQPGNVLQRGEGVVVVLDPVMTQVYRESWLTVNSGLSV